MHARLGLLLLASLVAFAPAVAASCPESCLDNSCSTAVARDSVVTFECYPSSTSQGHMAYDLVTGHLYAEARGCSGWYGSGGGGVGVLTRDRFRLVGPAGGGPVNFEARLLVSGGAGGFAATCSASILEQGGAAASANDGGAAVLNTVLGIPLVHAPGDEFVLECYAGGSAGGVGSMGFADAVLSFAGLPAGYGVTSCQGFAGDGAVAARPASWGSLKLRYR